MAVGHKQSLATRAKISAGLLAFHRKHSREFHSGKYPVARRNNRAARRTYMQAAGGQMTSADSLSRKYKAFRTTDQQVNKLRLKRKDIASQRRNAYFSEAKGGGVNTPVPRAPRVAPSVISGVVLAKRQRLTRTSKPAKPGGAHSSSALPTTGTKSMGGVKWSELKAVGVPSKNKKSRVLSSEQKAAKAARSKRRRLAKKG